MEDLRFLFMTMLLLIVIWFFYVIFSLVANYFFFKKIGKNKWLGLIPFVNDYIYFSTFWNTQAYVVYLVSDVLLLFIPYLEPGNVTKTIYCLASIATFAMNVLLMDKVRKAFGRGLGYLLGLVLLYPAFILYLAIKGTPQIDLTNSNTAAEGSET